MTIGKQRSESEKTNLLVWVWPWSKDFSRWSTVPAAGWRQSDAVNGMFVIVNPPKRCAITAAWLITNHPLHFAKIGHNYHASNNYRPPTSGRVPKKQYELTSGPQDDKETKIWIHTGTGETADLENPLQMAKRQHQPLDDRGWSIPFKNHEES